ncbi:protein phosphatase inhibitor 2-like isoform X2 [Mobula birostris]|uniref:protein phosphatase inhibitor 2-like isoform X2 n=1 Tax=Mobula birostris TaxID=1983395 RepID=UPI003B27C835
MQSQPSSSQAMDKPIKGILKRSRRLAEDSQKKSQKWDEMNIIATYKPLEKDYGHMTIDEVKTPFRYNPDDEAGSSSGPAFSVDELRTRISSLTTMNKGKHQQVKMKNMDNDKDDIHLVERESKRQFEQRRKQIYDEGWNIKRARELIAREQLDDSDDSDSDHDESYHYREMDEHQTLPEPFQDSSPNEGRQQFLDSQDLHLLALIVSWSC